MSRPPLNPWIKIAFELGPVLAFFIAYSRWKDATFTVLGAEYSGFIVVTAAFIPLMAVATLALWLLSGRLSAMQGLTLVLVVVFGGLTVWLNDERFFKMKPTIIYALFAAILGFGLLRGRSYLALLMGEVMPLQPQGWRILTWRLAWFFAALALANEGVWRLLSTDAWVDFKTFGLPAALFVFFMTQGGLLRRYGVVEPGE